MRVQRVVMLDTETESWTLLGDDLLAVESAEDYLGYLCAIERSPTTVRAYAHSLKLWFEFLVARGLSWDRAEVEDVARFVAWLRAPADNVVVLDAGAARRSPATVNRHLAGVFGFYDYQARSGAELADRLVAWRRVGRGSYKPFLHHVTRGRPIRTRPVKLAVDKAISAHPDRGADRRDPAGMHPAAGPVPVRAARRDRDAHRLGAGAAARRCGLP